MPGAGSARLRRSRRRRRRRWRRSSLCRRIGSRLRSRRLRLGFHLGLLFGEARIHFGGLRWMNMVVVLVRFRQLLAIEQQSAEAVVGAQLKIRVHLDGLEGAHLNADLAAHAHRDIDIEFCGVDLRLADVVRLLVLALLDVDALGRALFLADLAGDAAQPFLPVGPVIHQKRKYARVLRRRYPLLRILDGRQALFRDEAAGEILRRLGQPLQYSLTQQCVPPKTSYLSTSPSTISTLPKISTTSATLFPRHISSRIVRLIRLGGLTR